VNFALLPVKSPQKRQAALNGFLPAAHRETLARLMFEQTIAALCQAGGIDRVVVVTSDTEIARHARSLGALVFEETEQSSHSGLRGCRLPARYRLGATTALLVPIDVPLVTPPISSNSRQPHGPAW